MTQPRPIANPPGEGSPADPAYHDVFHYREPTRERYLNLLLHLAPYSDVLLVTGEPGSGKSHLLRCFIARAGDTWRICHVRGDTARDGKLLERIERELALRPGAPTASAEQRIEQLRQGLMAQRRSGLVPLVLIDDADELPPAAFALLATLTTDSGDEKLLGVLLLGDKRLEKIVASPAGDVIRSRIGHAFELSPLSERDTAAYIAHRLAASGVPADDLFTPAVNHSIFAGSGGLPARINVLADDVLRKQRSEPAPPPLPDPESVPDERPPRSGRMVVTVFSAAAVVAALSALLVYRAEVTEAARSAWQLYQPAPDTVVASAPISVSAPAAPPVEPAPVGAAPPSPEQADPAPTPSGTAAETGASEAPVPVEPDTAEMVEEQAPAPAVPSAPQAASESGRKPTADARSAGAIHDEDWLLAQMPGRYTVQLVVKGSQDSAMDFITKSGSALKGETAIYRTSGQDGLLFAVVNGVYPTYDEAKAAATRFAGRLRGVTPWARSIDVIQRQITVNRANPPVGTPSAPPALIEDPAKPGL